MTDKQKKIAMKRQKTVRCQGCGEILPQEGDLSRNRICENEKEQ